MSAFRIERQSYSRKPWRVLWADDGSQVWQQERWTHPDMGPIEAPGPVCFDRKRDASAWVAAHADTAKPTRE